MSVVLTCLCQQPCWMMLLQSYSLVQAISCAFWLGKIINGACKWITNNGTGEIMNNIPKVNLQILFPIGFGWFLEHDHPVHRTQPHWKSLLQCHTKNKTWCNGKLIFKTQHIIIRAVTSRFKINVVIPKFWLHLAVHIYLGSRDILASLIITFRLIRFQSYNALADLQEKYVCRIKMLNMGKRQ